MKNRPAVVILFAAAILFSAFTGAEAGGPAVYSASVSTNGCPIAENLEYTTYRNVAIKGRFSAYDPDGDALKYELVSVPAKGTVTVEGDEFTYTPAENKKGRDRFTYAAIDGSGTVSDEALVEITIKKQKCSVCYCDMDGDPALSSAIALADAGIYTGKQVCGKYFFCPDAEVTRAEFLDMCLNAAGIEMLSGVTKTGFDDDGAMAEWQRQTAATALMCGSISGYRTGCGTIVFDPDAPVSVAEAIVMLNSAAGLTDVTPVFYPDGENWVSQAAANLTSCGIIGRDSSISYSETLTMSGAADMLASAMSVLEKR